MKAHLAAFVRLQAGDNRHNHGYIITIVNDNNDSSDSDDKNDKNDKSDSSHDTNIYMKKFEDKYRRKPGCPYWAAGPAQCP